MLIPLALLSLSPGSYIPMSPALEDAPVEFGRVQWQRKLEPALAEAGRVDKPVLLLFQEVPG